MGPGEHGKGKQSLPFLEATEQRYQEEEPGIGEQPGFVHGLRRGVAWSGPGGDNQEVVHTARFLICGELMFSGNSVILSPLYAFQL